MVTQMYWKKKLSRLKLLLKKIKLIVSIQTNHIWTHKKYLLTTKLNIILGLINSIMIKLSFWPTVLKKYPENCNKY